MYRSIKFPNCTKNCLLHYQKTCYKVVITGLIWNQDNVSIFPIDKNLIFPRLRNMYERTEKYNSLWSSKCNFQRLCELMKYSIFFYSKAFFSFSFYFSYLITSFFIRITIHVKHMGLMPLAKFQNLARWIVFRSTFSSKPCHDVFNPMLIWDFKAYF